MAAFEYRQAEEVLDTFAQQNVRYLFIGNYSIRLANQVRTQHNAGPAAVLPAPRSAPHDDSTPSPQMFAV